MAASHLQGTVGFRAADDTIKSMMIALVDRPMAEVRPLAHRN
jgi:hypothetical protein